MLTIPRANRGADQKGWKCVCKLEWSVPIIHVKYMIPAAEAQFSRFPTPSSFTGNSPSFQRVSNNGVRADGVICPRHFKILTADKDMVTGDWSRVEQVIELALTGFVGDRHNIWYEIRL
jgi:hypothetical protein